MRGLISAQQGLLKQQEATITELKSLLEPPVEKKGVVRPFDAQRAAYTDRRLLGMYDARFHSTCWYVPLSPSPFSLDGEKKGIRPSAFTRTCERAPPRALTQPCLFPSCYRYNDIYGRQVTSLLHYHKCFLNFPTFISFVLLMLWMVSYAGGIWLLLEYGELGSDCCISMEL
jgi:hypothetical protein